MRSRLHRKIPIDHWTMFNLYSEPLHRYDNGIAAVRIRRGGGDPFQYRPSTMEVDVPGEVSAVANGYPINMMIHPGAAEKLRPAINAGPDIDWRFFGRIGAMSIQDMGTRALTTLSVSSWMSQMSWSHKTVKPIKGWPITRPIQEVLGVHDGDPPRGVKPEFYGDWDKVGNVDEGQRQRWPDVLAKWVNGTGIVTRETRDGRTQFFTLKYLEHFISGFPTPPIARDQALINANWEQRSEAPGKRQEYDILNENGNVVTRSTIQPPDDGSGLGGADHHDWTHVQAVTNQSYWYAYALYYQANSRQYHMPSVKLDLLHLMSSPRKYDREVAAWALSLETFQPVAFSGDWHRYVRGWHVATGITETITPDEWTIEVDVMPVQQMLGSTGWAMPQPRVWAQFPGVWNDALGRWAVPLANDQ